MALRWVRQNISLFGGDPSLVTLCGQSSGGANVSLHLFSRSSSGLFGRAVILAGGPVSKFALQYDDPDLFARKLARSLGLPGSSSGSGRALSDALKEVPAETLVAAAVRMMRVGTLTFAPVVEGTSVAAGAGGDAFLTEHPHLTLERGGGPINRVPVLMGTNRDDQAYQAWLYCHRDPRFESLTRTDAGLATLARVTAGEAAEMRARYFGENRPVGKKTTEDISRLLTDYRNCAVALAAEKIAESYAREKQEEQTPGVFAFLHSHRGEHTFLETFGHDPKAEGDLGVSHCDELLLLFDNKVRPALSLDDSSPPHLPPPSSQFFPPLNDSDSVASRRLWGLLLDFARSGRPGTTSSPAEDWWEPLPGSTKTTAAAAKTYAELIQGGVLVRRAGTVDRARDFWEPTFSSFLRRKIQRGPQKSRL